MRNWRTTVGRRISGSGSDIDERRARSRRRPEYSS
ncbi:MAG: hypothetical protein KatS3mg038_0355 [Candidatus Kapaibacterium sp.]|nr:MAG: hypothetical protein KatS3mg038_0355 [Candidatus Kapabacteria bacterium]